MYREIEAKAKALSDTMIQNRRILHKIPETAWQEKETTRFLAAALKEMGYEIITGEAVAGHETGVIATLRCQDGPTFVLRFDIDALAANECSSPSHFPSKAGFRSGYEGFMHACGHDGHAAIGLGCARLLMDLRHTLRGTIRLIFQPAEEGGRGAAPIVQRGWLDDADFFLAGHIVGREYTDGQPADVISGVCNSLATTKFDAIFTGRSCHAASPEQGASVISAMASAILNLNGIPRHSEGATFLNIGRISAGEGRNIVAGQGKMELEVRGATTELNQYMENRAFQILQDSAHLYGCQAEIEIQGNAPSLTSSPELCATLRALCRERLEFVRVLDTSVPFRASEDAAVMLERVICRGGQGAYLLFPTDNTAPLHSCSYDFNETILAKAAAVFTAAVYQFCGR